MNNKTKNPGIARLVIVLFAITAVCSALLGCINYITADTIAAITEQKTADAMQEVLPSASYEEVSYTGDDSRITAVHAADGGYVVSISVSGSQGMIDMLVGVAADGSVTGVAIIDMEETPGLGDKASEESFRSQYIGQSAPLAVTKDGGSIDALTGATVTSRAVTNGVNAACDAVDHIG